MIRSHHGRTPQIAASAYIDPQAVVIGDVSIGDLSSVWPCVVIRGDVNWIRIGGDTGEPVALLGPDAPGAKSIYTMARAVAARLEAKPAAARGSVVEID